MVESLLNANARFVVAACLLKNKLIKLDLHQVEWTLSFTSFYSISLLIEKAQRQKKARKAGFNANDT
jgi:hypothetical protein